MIKVTHIAVLISTTLLASACTSVVTAPFRAVGTVVETAVDATTQTQQEADEDRGKRLRKAEKNENKLRKKCKKNPDSRACDDLRDLNNERRQFPDG